MNILESRHTVLHEALWAYRMACHGATKVSPYDKKVKAKTFEQGELVWKLVLPIGTKSSKFGKWSPTWEGPFRVNRCVPGNAYILETLEGEEYSRALNGKYLKKYYPSV